MLWVYDFSDYKEYCHLFGLVPSRYKSLLNYKRFLEIQKEEFGGV
jgi:hypothetical protein